jgi:subtilase family serine protease
MKEHRMRLSLMISMWRRLLLMGMMFGSAVLPGNGETPLPLLPTNQAQGQVAAQLGRKTLHGHVLAVTAGLTPKGRLDAGKHLRLAIGLPLRNKEALNTLLLQLYDPASPQYRHYLSAEQFAEKFGPTEQDCETVSSFARQNGLAVIDTSPNRTLLVVTGSVADVEKTFGVKMQIYQDPKENRTFYAPDSEPSLDVAVRALHVSGLDNYVVPHPKNLVLSATDQEKRATPKSGSGPGGSYIGNDFRAAYAPGVSLDGSGQAVGLVEYGGYHASDITAYENKAGLPNVALLNVLLNGFNGSAAGDSSEICLDIEMAIAMAPGLSQVIVYEDSLYGDTASLNNVLLNRMATDNLAKQLSCSWDMTIDATTEQIFQQYAAQGQSFFDASGDVGAYPPGPIPTPDDDSYIIIVGGTTLTTGPDAAWASETTWNWAPDAPYASSGGISQSYTIPTWQQGISMTANQGSTSMRNIPDVSMTADNIFIIANHGKQTSGEGGTSCAAPLWAGFVALVNQQAAANGLQPVGFLNPALYAICKGTNYAACFHDITTGDNTNSQSHSKFHAVAGYDLCTGWGTPKGQALIDALAPPQPFLDTGSVSPSSGVTNDVFTYRVHYTDATGSAPLSEKAYIDGSPYDMQLESGSTANGTYKFVENGLSLGSHNYRFKFQTALGTNLFLPAGSNTYSGPTVMLRVEQPTFSPSDGQNGTYPVMVTLSCATTNVEIRYTTNGTSPTESSQLYTVPIAVTGRVLLTCAAFETGMLQSAENSLYYNFPAIRVSPASNNFSLVRVGTATNCTFTVQNTGGGTLVGSADGLSDPFQIVSTTNYSLAASQNQDVVVQYTPTAEVTNTGNISFSGGDGAVCPVTGVGFIPPAISVTPTNLDFGTEPVGYTNGTVLNFTVQNAGGSILSGSASVSAPFAVVTGATYDLAAGQTSNVSIRYVPILQGAQSRSVAFTGGGGTTCSVSGVTIGVLNINSIGADVTPSPGIYSNVYGTVLTNTAAATIDAVTTQYACRGWTMTGNVPTGGTTNSFWMTQTNNATLTWLWRTNFLLTTHASGSGTVDNAGGWYASGSNVTITASPVSPYRFGAWSGDTNGATISGSNITIRMTSAKSITANFGVYLSVQAAGLNGSTQKINIAVTPNDYSNNASGTTPFVRCYGEGSVVGLSAPGTLAGGWKFADWTGVDTQIGTNATVTMLSNTVVRALYDPAPVVVITNPTSSATYATTNKILNIRGKASNAVCSIARVEFSSDRGGSGVCTGTTNWSYNGITLYNGPNIITVTVYDTYSNAASDALTVTYASKHAKLQNLVLLGGAVVRQISMADDLTPGTTNTIQWQVEAFEPVLSGVKIRLPDGGSVTNVTLNGVMTGVTNGAPVIGDWQSRVYSFQADWITPNMPGTCRIRFLTARQDGYAYVNANIPDGIDSNPYGTDGKEIARDISGVGTTPAIQNEVLTRASKTFESLAQAGYRRGSVVQNIQMNDNLTPGNVVTCRWSILTYPGVKARMRVDLPVEADFLGTGAKKATSNTWWRLPATGKLVEYNGSLANDSVQKLGTYYGLKQYCYQYVWTVPNDPGTCRIGFDVTLGTLTNWIPAVLPDGVDGRVLGTAGLLIERDIASTGGAPAVLTMGVTNATGNISYKGDADWYQFTVATTGTYRVQTYLGTLTDTIMKLYGPGNQNILLEQNDNAVGRASRIIRSLDPGIYYIKITAPLTKTGTYKIIVGP